MLERYYVSRNMSSGNCIRGITSRSSGAVLQRRDQRRFPGGLVQAHIKPNPPISSEYAWARLSLISLWGQFPEACFVLE